jgi:asparagine synthase (glutamine-hydrolysing)
MSGLSDLPVKTFSIGFEDHSYNELPYAREIARRYSTDHHEFIVKPSAIDLLPKLVWHYGEPFADSSALPTYYVAEMSRRHVTVALNGDAGDELFAGYPRYLAYKLAGRIGRFPFLKGQAQFWKRLVRSSRRGSFLGKVRRFIPSLVHEGPDRYLNYMVYFDDEEREQLYLPEMRRLSHAYNARGFLQRLFASCRSNDEIARLLFTDIHSYLPDDLLVKVDIAAMANSLEGRSPFLDHRLVEFAAALPTEWKLRGRKSKYILKDTFSDLLPPTILRRGKMGFGVPIAGWFRGELKEYPREILLDHVSLSRGYFDPARVRGLVDAHQEGITDHAPRLWALLVLELWHRAFIDRGGLP